MNVLIGFFMAECNEHVPNLCSMENFVFKYGNDIAEEMKVKDIFDEAEIELIPSIYANGFSSGCIESEAFSYIAEGFLKAVRENIKDIDGIYLFLHGASKVIGLNGGSGEHYILQEIRKIVGRYVPIAVVMDPHGNISQELVENCTILRCYRESPHTDMFDTYRWVAKELILFLKKRRNIRPVYRKIPMILGGERSVSTDEPMLSINKKLNEEEQSERILSISFHIGYIRHDSAIAGCGLVVVPDTEKDIGYANEVADRLYEYIFSKRHEFHYHGTVMDEEEAVKAAIEFNDSPVFLTDSGDNTTSGSTGANTFVLRQFLKLDDYNGKKILFSAIKDSEVLSYLLDKEIGCEVEFDLGMEYDDLSKKVHIKATIKHKGYVENIFGAREKAGDCVTVSLLDKPIDVLITTSNTSYTELHQFKAASLGLTDYDIIIVKQGYIFPELSSISKLSIMSLTSGATDQRSEKILFKLIMRPIFPIDNI